jgi:tyrosine phenol-lyase
MTEPIRFTSPQERENIIREAHFNLFQVAAENVTIDLLTDSGTSAMSSEQWAGMLRADESYAGSVSWYRLKNVIKNMTGMPHILPTHQGRASERILFSLIGGKDKVIANNNHFDTTRANIEFSGAKAIDLVVDQAYEINKAFPFKGNLDSQKLQTLIRKVGAEQIPLCMITITNNSVGGQPVSLANIKEIKNICQTHNIPLFIDAARFAENAYFIKQREKEYAHLSVREIVRQIFDLADGATISAKKDALVNTGGLLLIRDNELAKRAINLLILTEGFTTYGGLAGRDLEAMAEGFLEAVDEDYLRYRIRSVDYLAEKLLKANIPIVQPTGGHAVYIDAKSFCPHIAANLFPGQAIVCALYRVAGVRATELGSVMFGKRTDDPGTVNSQSQGQKMELVRLALPRRVYTQSHMDYVAEALIEIYKDRDKLKGLRIIEEPSALRHFSAKFAEV